MTVDTASIAGRRTLATLETDTGRLAARAREEGRLGIDTEFMPEGRYRPLLCLVQVVRRRGDRGARPARQGFDPAPLAEVLADPAVEIVLHAGRQDVAILRREWAPTFTNVFDTQVAAGFAGFSAQAGYTGLLARRARHPARQDRELHALGRPAADRPSSSRYAREDVEHLLPLADELQRRLSERGRLGVGARGVPRDRRAPPTSAIPRRPGGGCRASPGLDPRERAVARELAAWRERTAAAEDRPVGAVRARPDGRRAGQAPAAPTRRELAQIRGVDPDVVRRRARRHPRGDRARPRGAADPARRGRAPRRPRPRRADDRARRGARARPRAGGRARLRADRRARRPRADRRRRPARRGPSPTCARCAAGGASWSARSCSSCCAGRPRARRRRTAARAVSERGPRSSELEHARRARRQLLEVAAGDQQR